MKDKCYLYRATVLRVTDGDTIIADIDVGFGFKMSKAHVRLDGIDAGEVHSKDEQIKAKGLAANDWLLNKIGGKEVYLCSGGFDKYGRVLASVYTLDGVCCNEELIILGLALIYEGGKKNQELLKS